MRHVSQKLRLGAICQFGSFTSRRVLLDTVTQTVHHLIDLGFERVHFTAGLNGDEARKVTIGCCGSNLGKRTHLGR